MSRVKALALAMALPLVLAGCAWMFEFNLFDALDNPPTPTAADYLGSSGLDRLDEDLDSPAVVDAITSTAGLVDTILSNIATEFLGGDPPTSCSGPDAPQAAILYADLALKTSEGEELVNNIAAVVLDLQNQISGTSTVAEILAAIIPPEALASEATFTAMVEALLAANNVYLLLGAYVDGATSDGVAENDLPPGSAPWRCRSESHCGIYHAENGRRRGARFSASDRSPGYHRALQGRDRRRVHSGGRQRHPRSLRLGSSI